MLATTDAGGQFVFNDLAPGTYTIHATRLGYKEEVQTVSVAAGEVTNVELRLSAAPIEGLAYTRVFGPIHGKFVCGFGTGALSGPCKLVGWSSPSHPVESAWTSATGGENNIFTWYNIIRDNKTAESDLLANLTVEVAWIPTSGGSRWLQASIEDTPKTSSGGPGGRNLSEPEYASASGASPLRMHVTPGVKNLGHTTMPVDWPGFAVGVFPTIDPASPAVTNPANGRSIGIGASAYTEQTFELWISLHYNAQPRPGYTALPV